MVSARGRVVEVGAPYALLTGTGPTARLFNPAAPILAREPLGAVRSA